MICTSTHKSQTSEQLSLAIVQKVLLSSVLLRTPFLISWTRKTHIGDLYNRSHLKCKMNPKCQHSWNKAKNAGKRKPSSNRLKLRWSTIQITNLLCKGGQEICTGHEAQGVRIRWSNWMELCELIVQRHTVPNVRKTMHIDRKRQCESNQKESFLRGLLQILVRPR